MLVPVAVFTVWYSPVWVPLVGIAVFLAVSSLSVFVNNLVVSFYSLLSHVFNYFMSIQDILNKNNYIMYFCLRLLCE